MSDDGENASKYACSTSDDSRMKPIITNQCAAPTTPHLSIRVWPRVSRQHVRRAGAAPVGAARVRLTQSYDREHLPDGAHHEHDRHGRDRQ